MAGADKKKADGASKKIQIAKELKEIGHNACLACRTAPCAWSSPIDYDIVKARRVELDVERERLRSIPKSTLMVESFVAKSVTLGGNPQMTREAMSHELEAGTCWCFLFSGWCGVICYLPRQADRLLIVFFLFYFFGPLLFFWVGFVVFRTCLYNEKIIFT